jgi:hypothetical protein
MLRTAAGLLAMRTSFVFIFASAVSSSCANQQVTLHRSDGASENFAIRTAAHWRTSAPLAHCVMIDLVNEGSARSDSSSRLTLLFEFALTPLGPGRGRAWYWLTRALSEYSSTTTAAVLLLDRFDSWSVLGSVVLAENDLHSVVPLSFGLLTDPERVTPTVSRLIDRSTKNVDLGACGGTGAVP